MPVLLLEESEPTQPQLSPPLKWAGGKRWLVPQLARWWRSHRRTRLVEPLCGGLAVTLGLRPKHALCNDVNVHAISFYRWLQRGFVIEMPMENEKSFYYTARARFNDLVVSGGCESHEAASLFYYLNRTGYNGLCRFNRSGLFNVPFGSYGKIRYTRDFRPYVAAFRGWRFGSGDFAGIKLKPDDFVYADPPYDVEFTQYSKETFGWSDQERLVEWLARHPGPVVLSNQATDRVVELYRRHGFHTEIVVAPRMISCNGDRTPAREVLATRNLGTAFIADAAPAASGVVRAH